MPSESVEPPIESLDDLLTDEQRERLRADLAEMARVRRRAEVESRNLPTSSSATGRGRRDAA